MTKEVKFITTLIDDKETDTIVKKRGQIMEFFLEHCYAKDLFSNYQTQEDKGKDLFKFLVKNCIDRYHIKALADFKELDNINFEKTITSLKPAAKQKYDMLSSIPKIYHEKVTALMLQFADGFGHVDYDGALLAVAQIKARKKNYNFNPTVLDNSGYSKSELQDFLKIIAAAKLPVRECFILQMNYLLHTKHWISGDILITDKKEVKVVIFDGMGSSGSAMRIIFDYFKDAFNGKDYSLVEIFYSKLVRQKGINSKECFFYALTDIEKSYRYDTYQYSGMSLFDYLSLQNQDQKDNYIEKIVNLPLPFLLETKSNSVRQEIRKRPLKEQTEPVNKRKETAGEAVEKYFYLEKDDENKLINRNKRINYILSKNCVNAFIYIWQNRDKLDTLDSMLSTNSLDGFKKRISLEEKPITQPPLPPFIEYYSTLGLIKKPAPLYTVEHCCSCTIL